MYPPRCAARRRPVGSCAGWMPSRETLWDNLSLRAFGHPPLTMREDQGTNGRGNEQCGGHLEGDQVGTQRTSGPSEPSTLPPYSALAASSPSRTFPSSRCRFRDQQNAEPDEEQDRQPPAALDGLDQRVRGVHSDHHEDEEEQHHHRAGVNDDLDHSQEGSRIRDVEDRQIDHGEGDEQRCARPFSRSPCRAHRSPRGCH